MTIYGKIIGTGSYLPPKRITNDELAGILAEKGVETSDEWIRTRSGILARHYADQGVVSSDLGARAAEKALEMANCQANDIELIIVATSTSDFFGGFPSTACMVQKKLGITSNCAAFDVQAVCSGFLYALSVADSFIRAGVYRKVLVVGAETYSRIIDYNDRTTCVLFGDGAGAVVLSASDEPGILSTALHADGHYGDILSLPGHLNNGAIEGKAFVYMDGKAVFKLAVTWLDKVGMEALDKAGLKNTDIDWMVPHQANLRIMQSSAKKLDIPSEKIIVTVDQHGNTSAASIPLAIDAGVRDGRIKSGQNILLAAIGGGLTWGAVVIRM
ncbi:ketoacyl-ACP synthase III [Oxalobacter aliiformigenes]|jgi:3-oxoacyl-[acyl-carrier-protein] synthase III|uniref:Beta-ketoacyl-[acyl-carrier-protein] synthase III n=1 Tax=Oxalobacter aliiformigenes TaxID=2946593 RepID=A0A9E9LH57_9BURK|nr:beta-ketoacyl-ACP synthase III [Oxalobacter aliiformigenes]WAV89023.1 ketoacyl-ACP synthase III [Oxalobacter aliiformigenes]WAV91039.1 ketoacyl-ACP synthase III [Oxalobacter aliiformigenes]WAV93113.1 ketoacyl-ACP synthase III [Oxalobacter aliiformigenes]WAV95381.1 ketoacyl-ACP synthase III [Oxalobacter aliiformigenes]WAV96819.1 ketoacyl-ACP synthase III [Oxalobacter aliiformigenes]